MGDEVRTRVANLQREEDQRSVCSLLNAYAREPVALGRELDELTLARLIEDLRANPSAVQFLGLVNEHAVGLAVCFLGYSSFAARPLLNIHDLVVRYDFRRRGVGTQLLKAAEAYVRDLGCCKVTLEVRQDNVLAQSLYRRHGFTAGIPAHEFWTKPLGT